MQQLYQDSMAIARHFGKPTMFVTCTANPHWPEIIAALGPNQRAENRPDIVARVFHEKVKALLQDLKTQYGRYLGIVWTIEYQKRGLPHIHILLFLHRDDNFLERARVDELICAELPDPTVDLDGSLRRIVESQMTHGPCGVWNPSAPCMKDNSKGPGRVCEKKFPKPYQTETIIQTDGYPLYRRRQDGRTWMKRVNGRDVHLDNTWVVPYNPYLTRKYSAHINVEICGSVQAIKYIHKYVYKGGDRTTMELKNNPDEITRHLNGRYISPNQAAWNLFEFRSHTEDPSITRLIVHLPDEQPVYFPEDATAEQIQIILNEAETTLTAWFRYNQQHPDGRALLYQEFPAHYVYQPKRGQRRWTPRQRGTAIGRMYHSTPVQGEKHYLRLLLTAVRGAQSFDDIRTVDEVLHPTYRSACTALRLLEDDGEWVSCFIEAVRFSTGSSLRSLFVIALMHSDLADPCALWNRFRVDLCDDLPRRMHEFSFIPIDFEDSHLDYGLYLIAKALQRHDKTLADFSLPAPILNWSDNIVSPLISAELEYDQIEQARLRDAKTAQLNEEQRQALNSIVSAVTDSPKTAHFFIHGPAGTGKTFLYECLCHHFRAQAKIVLCVAFTGIAAQLLSGGRTSHSRFKIPIICHDTSTCSITARSELAHLLKHTALIIWDEVPMQHKHNFTAVNASLCDILQFSDVFGGIPVILGGDFAQITPVVP